MCWSVLRLSCLMSSRPSVCKKPLGSILFNKTSGFDTVPHFYGKAISFMCPLAVPPHTALDPSPFLLSLHFFFSLFYFFSSHSSACKILWLSSVTLRFSKMKMRTSTEKCQCSHGVGGLALQGPVAPMQLECKRFIGKTPWKTKGGER